MGLKSVIYSSKKSTWLVAWSWFVLELACWYLKINPTLMNAQFLCLKLCIFSVPHEIRKGYGSMTHGAYGTHRTSEAHRTYEIIN